MFGPHANCAFFGDPFQNSPLLLRAFVCFCEISGSFILDRSFVTYGIKEMQSNNTATRRSAGCCARHTTIRLKKGWFEFLFIPTVATAALMSWWVVMASSSVRRFTICETHDSSQLHICWERFKVWFCKLSQKILTLYNVRTKQPRSLRRCVQTEMDKRKHTLGSPCLFTGRFQSAHRQMVLVSFRGSGGLHFCFPDLSDLRHLILQIIKSNALSLPTPLPEEALWETQRKLQWKFNSITKTATRGLCVVLSWNHKQQETTKRSYSCSTSMGKHEQERMGRWLRGLSFCRRVFAICASTARPIQMLFWIWVFKTTS